MPEEARKRKANFKSQTFRWESFRFKRTASFRSQAITTTIPIIATFPVLQNEKTCRGCRKKQFHYSPRCSVYSYNYYCTIVLLYDGTTVPLYYHCVTVLLYYCTVVLMYYCTVVLLYYCTIVLLYYCNTVLMYYCTIVLPYYCTTLLFALLYYCTHALLYYCTTVLS